MDPITKKPWLWQVTLLSILLGMFGVLLVTALQSQRRAEKTGLPGGGYAGLLAAYEDLKAVNSNYRHEVDDLHSKLLEYESSMSSGNSAVAAVRKELDQARFLAGLTAVKGPGLVITLRDSKKAPQDAPPEVIENFIIHDYDIWRISNELRAAGAEAISVNDQRITSTTAIRCVGPVMQVNGIPVGAPFVVKATGPPTAMETGLHLPGGVLSEFEAVDKEMATVQKKNQLTIPAYSGSSNFSYTVPITKPIAR